MNPGLPDPAEINAGFAENEEPDAGLELAMIPESHGQYTPHGPVKVMFALPLPRPSGPVPGHLVGTAAQASGMEALPRVECISYNKRLAATAHVPPWR